MDLDHLKEAWKKQVAESTASASKEQLLLMLTKQSRSPVARMKRNLFMELIVVIITLGGVAIWYLFDFNGKFIEISLLYILMILLFLVYYYRKNKLLNEMQCVSCHVKSNLELQISSLSKLVKIYFHVGTWAIPALILFLGWLFYIKKPSVGPKIILFNSPAYEWWQTMLAWLALAIIITIPVYFMNKKYVHWLYGKHINRLKRILHEMDDK